jgi:hypothetical protein
VIQTQSQLEREIASLKDRLAVAVDAARNAKALLLTRITLSQRDGEFERLLALVSAVADESAMAAPLLARLGWGFGMKEAADVSKALAKMEKGEWEAGCLRVAEEIEKKAKLAGDTSAAQGPAPVPGSGAR